MKVAATLTPIFADDTELLRKIHVLQRSTLPSNTIEQARFLLNTLLVRSSHDGVAVGRIVETEAYPPGDPAAHHYRRMTPRNRSLFLERGHAYVYRAYGTSWMLNVSSEHAGVGAGVLIRALVPEAGTAMMALRRGNIPARDLARGPGRLAAALDVDRGLDGIDLCQAGSLYLARYEDAESRPAFEIGVSTRIGITRAVEEPLRFFVLGSRFLSGPGWLNRAPEGAPEGAQGGSESAPALPPCHRDARCPK